MKITCPLCRVEYELLPQQYEIGDVLSDLCFPTIFIDLNSQCPNCKKENLISAQVNLDKLHIDGIY